MPMPQTAGSNWTNRMGPFVLSMAGIIIGMLLAVPGFASVGELFEAIQKNDLKTVERGLARGFSVDSTDEEGLSLLMEAARSGHAPIVAHLVKSKAQINQRNAQGETAVMLAAVHGHLSVVQMLHKAGAEISHSGWTALHYAAYHGYADICQYLLENNVSIDSRSPNGSTPLMLAARQGHEALVKALLWERADPNLVNEDGLSALAMAAQRKHLAIVALLKQGGAKK